MRALYLGLLVTALAFLALLAVATLVLGTTWTLRNRAALLATSLGLGAAVGLASLVRRAFSRGSRERSSLVITRIATRFSNDSAPEDATAVHDRRR